MKRLYFFVSVVFVVFVTGTAQANVIGADTQNFNPITSGLDFVTVHSSETLHPGLINFGAFLNFAVNSLPEYEGSSGASRTNFKDLLLSSDVNIGLGLRRGWDLGLSFPAVLAQDVESDVTLTRGEFAATGLTEVRANTKLRFFGDEKGGLATILTANFNQIQNNPFTGDGAGPTLNAELAYDWTYQFINMAVNVGHRFRDSGDVISGALVEPLPNQWIASFAASHLWPEHDTKLIGELMGSWPAKSVNNASDRSLSAMEILIGIKHDWSQSLALHAGAGTEVFQGSASPDWRVYSGLNYVFGPIWGEQEGLVRVETDSLQALRDGRADVFTGSPRNTESFVAKDVLFETASAKISPGFERSLKLLTKYLEGPPAFRSLVIEGHTDSVGSASYNLGLSRRRAESVREALVRLGVPAEKIRAVGFGESRPIADNGNFQGRALNRRVEFQVNR